MLFCRILLAALSFALYAALVLTEVLATSSSGTGLTLSPTSVPTASHPSQTSVASGSRGSTSSTLTADSTPTGTNLLGPNQLPIQPEITPAIGVTGVVLIVLGLTYNIVGIKNRWLHVFLSTAFLTSLGVTVLIIYVMTPPVSNAIQGAYFVAVFFTGTAFGAISLVFKEWTEGFGCLLGGFCLSMWILMLKPGGLFTSTESKGIFIGAISAGAYALSFSRYMRPYALIVTTSFSGATSTVLGIDCFTRAGLKEYWLYIWDLNSNIFPLHTGTYPVTRHIRVELAAIVVLSIFGMLSQFRLWKAIVERRKKWANQQIEEIRNRHEAEAEMARQFEEANMRDLVQWEEIYGNKEAGKSPSIVGSNMTDIPRKPSAEIAEVPGDCVHRSVSNRSAGPSKELATTNEGELASTELLDGKNTVRHDITFPAIEQPPPISMGGDDGSSGIDVRKGASEPVVLSLPFKVPDQHGKANYGDSHSVEAISGDLGFAASTDSRRLSDQGKFKEIARQQSDSRSQTENLLPVPGGVADDETDLSLPEESADQALSQSQSRISEAQEPVTHNKDQPQFEQSQPLSNKPYKVQVPAGEEINPCSISDAESKGRSRKLQSSEVSRKDESDCGQRDVQSVPKSPSVRERVCEIEKQEAAHIYSDKDMILLSSAHHEQYGPKSESISGSIAEKRTADFPPTEEPTFPFSADNGKPEAIARLSEGEETQENGIDVKSQSQRIDPSIPTLTAGASKKLPNQVSQVVIPHRTSEWAKHLSRVDVSADHLELPINDDAQHELSTSIEIVASVNAKEPQKAALNAPPPPGPTSRVPTISQLPQRPLHQSLPPLRIHHKTNMGATCSPDSSGSDMLAQKSLSPSLSRGSTISSPNLLLSTSTKGSMNSFGMVYGSGNASTPLLSGRHTPSPIYENEETHFHHVRMSEPYSLMAQRENMIQNRMSSVSLTRDSWAPRSLSRQSMDDARSNTHCRGSQINLVDKNNDDLSLSHRRALLKRGSHVSETFISDLQHLSTSESRLSVHTQKRMSATRPQMTMEAWRESLRKDITRSKTPLVDVDIARSEMIEQQRKARQAKQQMETANEHFRSSFAERVQRGDMQVLHREAMRRMQASANKRVNERP